VASNRPPEEAPTAAPRAARLFVALDLPAQTRAALVEWQARALRGRDDLRAVAPDALHVTLAFLGHRPVSDIEPITATVERAVETLAPARLAAVEARAVPRRRPRLFALDLADPDARAGAIQAAVSEALARGSFYEPERRSFWPHVTVARVPRAAPVGRTDRRTAPLTIAPPPDEFSAREVVLYRSHLGRGPARYEALARFTL
jgi:2'-5' RNA ligase